jgi:site-specific recombinase XerD
MQDKESSILWIIRCITALLLMRRHLRKSFKDADKDDIRSLLKWMDDKQYKASTHEKFRCILKFYYKVVYGNNEHYPQAVNWFSVNVGKEKMEKETNMDMSEYIEEEELQKLIEAAPTLQKKAFLACMYESGARPEEFLRLTNLDIKVDSKGAVFMLRGKTGERRVRIISFVKLLQQWLQLNPLKNQNQYPLWISTATNFKDQPLGLRGAQKIIEETLPKAGLTNKHCRLYILRHSRATHLANHLTEAQMCIFFGWQHGTKVVRRYIHLSGKDVDNALIALNEEGQVKDQTDRIQYTRQRLSNDIHALEYKLSILDKTAFSSEQECKKIEQQLQVLTAQKDRLEKWIANISNNDDLKQIVKENVKAALSKNKQVISVAFTALLQTLKSDPQMINIIYKILTANEREGHQENNDNAIKHLESNKSGLLDLAEKHYENIIESLTNSVIALTAAASSNPELSSPSSSTSFIGPSNQSGTYRREE